MPYVITTSNPTLRAAFDEAGGRGIDLAERIDAAESRTAVATLDEARQTTLGAVIGDRDYEDIRHVDVHAAHIMDESGGTIGPLPDGTVIEVRPTSWLDLAASCDTDVDASDGYITDDEQADILAAFNAR